MDATAATQPAMQPSAAETAAPAGDATFITATNVRRSEPVFVADPPGMDRARQLHSQLAGVVTTLNDKMASVLKKQESEFLRAYRAHMYNVQKELAMLRAKADDAAVQLAKNDRIRQLEAERDWYRTEALRLDQFCTGLKADVEFMRDKLAALEDDRDWLESQLKGAKRSNAILRAEGGGGADGDGAASVVAAAGGGGADSPARSPASRSGSVVGPQAPAHAMAVHNPVSTGPGVAASVVAAAAGGGGHGPRLRKGSTSLAAPAAALSLASARGPVAAGPPRGGGSATSRLHSALAAAATMEAESVAGGGGGGDDRAAAGQLRSLQAQVRDLSEQLATATAAAEALRAKNGRLKAANTALRSGRGELESFFVQCVEDVRKEVSRRRVKAITQGSAGGPAAASATGAGGVPLGLLPQLKGSGGGGGGSSTALGVGAGAGNTTASKKSLLASASAAALATQYSDGISGAGGAPAMPTALGNDHAVDRAVALAKARHVGLDEFTPLDRRAVIARLLEDEFVLHALYGVVFKAHAADVGGAPPPLPPTLAEIAQLQLQPPPQDSSGDEAARGGGPAAAAASQGSHAGRGGGVASSDSSATGLGWQGSESKVPVA